MTEPALKCGPGRPPKHGEAMSGRLRQRLYAQARRRETAEVIQALKLALRTDAERTVFMNIYKGTQAGQRLRRGLAHMLDDDPATLAFFDSLISSHDENT